MLAKLKVKDQQISDDYLRLSVNEFRSNLADAFKYTTVNKDCIILTKNGEERAGLVPLEFVQLIDDLIQEFSSAEGNERITISELKLEIEKLLRETTSGQKLTDREDATGGDFKQG